jgi:hypothetical protein
VLSGKAKFGIFGDGKELPQLAMAHGFKNGDFRSGYYRDQTITFATGVATIQQFFAQLYANPDVASHPVMIVDGSPASQSQSRWLLEEPTTHPLHRRCSPTGTQMPGWSGTPRHRQIPLQFTILRDGNEVAFARLICSCAEGILGIGERHWGIALSSDHVSTMMATGYLSQ